MSKVIGDTTATPNPCPDWAQTDPTKADYIRNKPEVLDGENGVDGVGIESVVQTTTSTEDGGTNIVTVTKTDGTASSFEVLNGTKGSTGEKGETGEDGYSPVVSVSKSGKETTITITDKDGIKTATISDGADGSDASVVALSLDVIDRICI